MRHDALEEFRNANVDCASGDVTFIDDLGKDIYDDHPSATICEMKDAAEGDQKEIEVR